MREKERKERRVNNKVVGGGVGGKVTDSSEGFCSEEELGGRERGGERGGERGRRGEGKLFEVFFGF